MNKEYDIKIGDTLYIGSDEDCIGGLATVNWVGKWTDRLMWVSFDEIGSHITFNLQDLIDHQEEFYNEYGSDIARLRH